MLGSLTVGERYHVLLLGNTLSTGTDLILADLSLNDTTGYNPFSLFGVPSCNPLLEPRQVLVVQPDSAMGPALQAAFLMMEALGGKLLLFQTSVPNVGVGKITQRDNPTLYNTDSEHRLRVPEDIFFKKFAAEASKSQISIDVFSFRFASFTIHLPLLLHKSFTAAWLFAATLNAVLHHQCQHQGNLSMHMGKAVL